jgi:hypothetical protein
VSDGESSGSRARQVGVDDGTALGVAESVEEAPCLLRDWPALKSSARRTHLYTKVQVIGLRRVRVSDKRLHKARSQNSKSEALPDSRGEGLFHDPYGIGTRIMKPGEERREVSGPGSARARATVRS